VLKSDEMKYQLRGNHKKRVVKGVAGFIGLTL